MPCATKIWAAGVQASPAAQWLGVAGDRQGRVAVREDMTLAEEPNIYVLGDTAAFTPTGAERPLPGIAPVAKQAGQHTARALIARIEGRTPPKFMYRHYGNLATIGRKAAVADFGWTQLKGTFAWFVWGIAHVYFLVGHRNRFAVLVDWLWSYITYQRGVRLITGGPRKHKRLSWWKKCRRDCMNTKKARKLNLAMQGGGSHGAFGWGVLDRLLEDGRFELDGVSATSAGAMNAAVYAYGKMTGGPEQARALLEQFWSKVSETGRRLSPVRRTLFDDWMTMIGVRESVSYVMFDAMTRVLSPYQLNPFNYHPLRTILEETIDFEQLRQCTCTQLSIAATNVKTGGVRIFRNGRSRPTQSSRPPACPCCSKR
ncbi:patatin-like phospholipase family protein [Hankyongella ginsenosidimutans]|uniref:patatin-like phospholipase family protein n=1 Tax=Hankyongella ginsenosidimutans TaxID=1763828 RepID=UPI001FEB9794|nr:patatin-like phospholipase family protein [Hankyongella ginsenosidimutans]